jgi:hypothetical protein
MLAEDVFQGNSSEAEVNESQQFTQSRQYFANP